MTKQISDFFPVKGSPESIISNVTSGWAKSNEWDENFISRDLFQNQFDGCREKGIPLTEVKEDIVFNNDYRISSPVSFDLHALFWLGSEKDADSNVGQVGEGFKLAVTTLLRSHNVKIFTASANKALEIRLSDKAVGEKESMYPLVYDFYELEEEVVGNQLIISGAGKVLLEALMKGRYNFFYKGHPAVGKKLNSKANIEFFERIPLEGESESESNDGLLFYHSLLRVRLPNTPVVIVFNQKYANIEKKIGVDRDRKVFDESIRSMLLKQAINSGLEIRPYADFDDDLDWLLPLMQPFFKQGNALLSAALKESYYFEKNIDYIDNVSKKYGKYFEGMFASTPKRELSPEFMMQEESWKREGLIQIPSYFSLVGAKYAKGESLRQLDKVKKEAKSKGSRQPTTAEWKMIRLVESLMPDVFSNKDYDYHVFTNETLLGEYKEGNRRNTADIYLGASVFEKSAGEFFATITHEALHCKGFDHSNSFSRALTELVESLIDNPVVMESYNNQIGDLIKDIHIERSENGDILNEIDRLVNSKDPEELSRIVSKIPHHQLIMLIRDEKAGA